MKRYARALLVLIPLFVTTPAAPASAQDAATADALFQRGKEKMERRNYKAACALFLESYKQDPVPGALHALAVCHVEAGEVASAVMRIDEYLSIVEKLPPAQRAKHAERAKTASEQRALLAPQVPRLTLVLPKESPSGTRVILDSVELIPAALGREQPVDPGEHVVTTQAPGGKAKKHRFTILKGEKKRLELSVDEAVPFWVEPLPQPTPQRAKQGEVTSRPGPIAGERSISPVSGAGRDDRGNHAMSGYQSGAFVAGGVGALALVTGIVAGALVFGKKSVIVESCNGTKCTRERIDAAREAAESAQFLGAMSTAGFVIGGSGLALGMVLFLSDPMRKPPESDGPLELSVRMQGIW